MKQILKRTGTLLLSLCLTLSVWGVLTPFPASAAYATSGDYEYWINDDNTATITKYLGSGGDVTIPDTLDGHTVTEIHWYAFDGCAGLTSITVGANNPNYSSKDGVLFNKDQTELLDYPQGKSGSYTIPNSVAEIGDSAFSGCTGLTSVTIPDSVTTIGYRAFYGCTGLTSVTIPNSVTTIDSSTFEDCTKLTTVDIPDSVTEIGYEAFYGCTGLISVDIGNGVTEIGSSAFEDCTKLTTVDIPDGVITIGMYAFLNCNGLTSVTIPNSVTTIDDDAFSGCTELTSFTVGKDNPNYSSKDGVLFNKDQTELIQYALGKSGSYTIPNSVTTIDDDAFSGCTGLTAVDIPNSVTKIGDSAFSGCTGLTSVTIPNSVTWINRFAFYNCTGLTSVIIPDSVTTIGEYAFYGCTGLASIDIPDSVSEIGNYAFYGCTGLVSVDIPDSVTEIGYDAFSGCTGLTSVDIGDSVTEIGSGAFFGCTGLTSVIIPDSVTYIGDDAFRGCTGLTSIDIPNSVTTIGPCAFENCTGLTSVTIPDSVTEIGDDAFSGCTGLTSVNIPDSVTEIGDDAFSGCTGLASVTIPDSVITIGSSAFSGCSGLTSITVGANNPSYSSIDGVLFNQDQTELILCPAGKSGSCTIPDSVATIGSSAFSGCSGLTSITVGANNPSYSSKDGVLFNQDQTELILCPAGKSGSCTIPDSVATIGSSAFSGCTGLTSIVVDANNPNYSSKDGVLFNQDQTELILCPEGKSGSYTIPNSVTEIDAYAFDSCTKLTSVDIPNSVTTIGMYAFLDCTGLISVIIGDSVTTIENDGRSNIDGPTSFFGCVGLTSIVVDANNPNYSSKDGVLFNKDQTELMLCPEGKSGGYAIPDSVTKIGWDAFMDCAKLTSVDIPDSVTTIGWSAFSYCTGLTSVIIPDSVTEIGEGAFSYCTGLTSVTIGDSMTYIGMSTFYWCTGLTSVDIPDSVTWINGYAFYGCDNLTIYGKAGSYAEGFAMKNRIPFGTKATNQETGIVVEGTAETLQDDAVLNAKQTASSEDAVTYEITLTQNGQTIQPTGEVTVKIPLPESMKDKSITVYRIEADGSRTDMNAAVQNGCAVFTTDHFSQYVLEAKIMPADYTAVDAALAKVPEDLSGYTAETAQAVKDAVAAVERDLPITEQAKVDAMAKAIEDAVAALKKAEKPAVLGDIDGDGKVSVTDALAILRMAVGLSTPVDNADIDGMNGVTVTDALAALRIAVGLA